MGGVCLPYAREKGLSPNTIVTLKDNRVLTDSYVIETSESPPRQGVATMTQKHSSDEDP